MSSQQTEEATTNIDVPKSPVNSSGNREDTGRQPQTNDVRDTIINTDLPAHRRKMRRKPGLPKESNIEKAGIFSRMHFLFALPLIKLGLQIKRKVTLNDIPKTGPTESAYYLERAFTSKFHYFSTKYPKSKNVLLLIICNLYTKEIFLLAALQLLQGAVRILTAYFLYLFLNALRDRNETTRNTFLYSIGLFIAFIATMYISQQSQFIGSYTFNKIKAGIFGMLFRKIHKLSLLGVHSIRPGMVTGFISNDINNLEQLPILVNLICAPFIFIGGWGFVFSLWGWTSFIPFGILLLVILLQYIFNKISFPVKMKLAPLIEKRIGLTLEVLEAIRQVKLYAWIPKYLQAITDIRNKEIAIFKKIMMIDTFPRSFTMSCNTIGTFLMYYVHSLVVSPLNTRTTFPASLTIIYVKLLVITQTQAGFNFLLLLMGVSMKVNAIMQLPEKPQYQGTLPPTNPENAIEFKDFSGYWISPHLSSGTSEANAPSADAQNQKGTSILTSATHTAEDPTKPEYKAADHPAVHNVNLVIKEGHLVTVVGGVRSGKSSLLLSLTGEMQEMKGDLHVRGNYSYLAQEPILYSGSICHTVTYGRPYDEKRFWDVIEACCLTEEIRSLPKAELTEIGDQGIVFSVSQQARLALARALYPDTHIYLLDDQLSMMSLKMAKKVFKKAIQEFLKGRTVLLVTQLLGLMKEADYVIILDKGHAVANGSFDEIMKGNEDKGELIEDIVNIAKRLQQEAEAAEDQEEEQEQQQRRQSQPPRTLTIVDDNLMGQELIERAHENMVSENLDEGLFLGDEKLDSGRVTYKIYWKYFSAMFTWYTLPIFVILIGSCESVSFFYLQYLGKWIRRTYTYDRGALIAGMIVLAGFLLQFPKCMMYFTLALRASNKLHNQLLRGVLFSPMRFFDKNPLGRIMTRFSSDVAIMDKFITVTLLPFWENLTLFITYFFGLWIKTPQILVTAGALFLIYITFYAICGRILNQIRNLELTTRAPIYMAFLIQARTLLATRAHQPFEVIMQSFYKKVDNHTSASIVYMSSVRFFSFIMDYVTQIGVTATFCYLIPNKQGALINGYFTTILILLPGTMQWLLQGFVQLNLFFSSPARIINFFDNHKPIKSFRVGDKEVEEQDWPQKDEIEIQSATLRYTEASPPFLNNLSLHIQPKEKIAVIGRDRSGMSSIVHLLARSIDIDQSAQSVESGRESFVKIDSINTQDVGIQLLRESVIFIPQITYIFTASIRDNLDPWKQHTDDEIWEVLRAVNLDDFVDNLEKKLETNLSRGSSVFSVGQKQLFCLARGLLRSSKIVVQDDPIQHIDASTLRKVQKGLIEKYKDSTIITMTHRAIMAASYDKVVVLKEGRVAEFDEPYALLVENIGDHRMTAKKGEFVSIVEKVGGESAKILFYIAMKKYYERRGLPIPHKAHDSLGTLSEHKGEVQEDPSLEVADEKVGLIM